MGVAPHLIRGVFRLTTAIVCTAAMLVSPALAEETAPGTAATRGPETNLPLPRFVSLKASEANVRRGPSLSHRIDWVFKRRSMPLQVIAEYGHWRRVIDNDGQGGWVHYTMLSGARTVLITQGNTVLRARPTEDALENAVLEAGVIARLGDCDTAWCELSAGGYDGWARKDTYWGTDTDEIRD